MVERQGQSPTLSHAHSLESPSCASSPSLLASFPTGPVYRSIPSASTSSSSSSSSPLPVVRHGALTVNGAPVARIVGSRASWPTCHLVSFPSVSASTRGAIAVSMPRALAPIGILLNPAISALAMSASSLTVATNAALLKGAERHLRERQEEPESAGH